jgi:hypothetical protein
MSETRFVRLHDGREVAFRCLSETSRTTIVFVPNGTTPIEVIEDDVMLARFLRTLGGYGSLVALDRLGIGASDAFDPDRDLFDQLADSFVAVLDDIDTETAWLVIGPVPGPCLLARVMARHPSRLAGGALLNPSRQGSAALVEGLASLRAVLDRSPWTEEDPLRIVLPSRADDPAFGRITNVQADLGHRLRLRPRTTRLLVAPQTTGTRRPTHSTSRGRYSLHIAPAIGRCRPRTPSGGTATSPEASS